MPDPVPPPDQQLTYESNESEETVPTDRPRIWPPEPRPLRQQVKRPLEEWLDDFVGRVKAQEGQGPREPVVERRRRPRGLARLIPMPVRSPERAAPEGEPVRRGRRRGGRGRGRGQPAQPSAGGARPPQDQRRPPRPERQRRPDRGPRPPGSEAPSPPGSDRPDGGHRRGRRRRRRGRGGGGPGGGAPGGGGGAGRGPSPSS